MPQNLIWRLPGAYIILIIRLTKMVNYRDVRFLGLFFEKIFFSALFFDFDAVFEGRKLKITIKMGNGPKILSVFYFLVNFKIVDYRRKMLQILLACFVTMSGQKNKIVLTYIIPKGTYVQE